MALDSPKLSVIRKRQAAIVATQDLTYNDDAIHDRLVMRSAGGLLPWTGDKISGSLRATSPALRALPQDVVPCDCPTAWSRKCGRRKTASRYRSIAILELKGGKIFAATLGITCLIGIAPSSKKRRRPEADASGTFSKFLLQSRR